MNFEERIKRTTGTAEVEKTIVYTPSRASKSKISFYVSFDNDSVGRHLRHLYRRVIVLWRFVYTIYRSIVIYVRVEGKITGK